MQAPRPLDPRIGFTLIELVTVIVLIGIMAGIAAPSLTGVVRNSKLHGATGQVTSDLAYARILAVRSGQPVTLQYSATGYSILRGAEQIKRVDIGSEYVGVRLVPDAGGSSIVFNSRGMVRGGGSASLLVLSPRLEGPAQAAKVTVTPLGRTERDESVSHESSL